MAGRQPPIATPRAERELQQQQQHGLFHLRLKSTWGGNARTLQITAEAFTPSGMLASRAASTAMQSIIPKFCWSPPRR